MKADVDLERLLYQIADGVKETGKNIHWIDSFFGNYAEIEVRPFTQTKMITDGGFVGTNSVVARIEGRFSNQDFVAYLQVTRSKHDHRDIGEIGWHVVNQESLLKWAVFAKMKDFLPIQDDFVRRTVGERHKHVWAWDAMNVVPVNATSGVSDFTAWAVEAIPLEVMPYYMGIDVISADTAEQFNLIDKSKVWCVLSMTNLCVENWNDAIFGIAHRAPGRTRYNVVDLPTFIAINSYILGELRMRNVAVHAYHDDEGLGQLPMTDEIASMLQQSQTALKEWLERRWGDRFRLLLDRINWSTFTSVEFSSAVDGDLNDPHRQPADIVEAPDIRWFLPYSS